MGSPPTEAGSLRSKHPAVIALQRKQLVWSPLKMRNMRNYRRSFVPSWPTTLWGMNLHQNDNPSQPNFLFFFFFFFLLFLVSFEFYCNCMLTKITTAPCWNLVSFSWYPLKYNVSNICSIFILYLFHLYFLIRMIGNISLLVLLSPLYLTSKEGWYLYRLLWEVLSEHKEQQCLH